MRGALVLGLCAGLAPATAAFAELPRAGTCERRHETKSGFVETISLTWAGQSAVIKTNTDRYKGQVFALRAHDEGFKLSVSFEQKYVGLTELVLFSLHGEGAVRYRMGWISYDELPDDTRAVATINAFQEAECSLGS